MKKSGLKIGVETHSDLHEALNKAQRNERLQTAKLAHQVERCQLLEELASEQRTQIENLEAAKQALAAEKEALKLQLGELERDNVQLGDSLEVREQWLDQMRAKLKAYQREVEDTRKETRERRKSVTTLTEEKKRLERCLKQAVQGREKAMLEVDYLKAELFDQRKKLLNAYLDASKAS